METERTEETRGSQQGAHELREKVMDLVMPHMKEATHNKPGPYCEVLTALSQAFLIVYDAFAQLAGKSDQDIMKQINLIFSEELMFHREELKRDATASGVKH